MQRETLYIFLDEAGNFDFSPTGTRYFCLCAVVTNRPFRANAILDAYKYDCIEWGLSQDYFHCTNDNKHVRKKVFTIISEYTDDFRCYSLVIDKHEIDEKLKEPHRFYLIAFYALIHMTGRSIRDTIGKVIIVTDRIPINKRRHAIEKAIKKSIKPLIPLDIPYHILHHESRAHYGLQIADYCNWAIFRKFEKGDPSFYAKINEKTDICCYEDAGVIMNTVDEFYGKEILR